MIVLEFEAKTLGNLQGLPIPSGQIVDSPAQAARAAEEIGGEIVLKAQVPSGKRFELGGIAYASDHIEAAKFAKQMFNQRIGNYRVSYLLVEKKIKAVQELYISISYNNTSQKAAILATPKGGSEVENQRQFIKHTITLIDPTSEYLGRVVASRLGFTGEQLLSLTEIINKLILCFKMWDAVLLEINPLILDEDGNWWIADMKTQLDDEASFRQEDLISMLPLSKELVSPDSESERRAKEIDQIDRRGVAGRLVAFDGAIGFLIGGGGASLTIFDAILQAGIKPANYCEIGGNPSIRKIKELTKLILSQPSVKKSL